MNNVITSCILLVFIGVSCLPAQSDKFTFAGAIILTLPADGSNPIIKITNNEHSYDISTTEKTEYLGFSMDNNKILWDVGHIYEVKGDTVDSNTLKKSRSNKKTIIASSIKYLNPPPYDADKVLDLAVMRSSIKYFEAAKEAIEKGANVNKTDKAGNAVIHTAVRWSNPSMIELLLNAGADINAKGYGGDTPLHEAVDAKKATNLECLLQNGADPNIEDDGRKTPWYRANQFEYGGGCKGCLDVFKKFGISK